MSAEKRSMSVWLSLLLYVFDLLLSVLSLHALVVLFSSLPPSRLPQNHPSCSKMSIVSSIALSDANHSSK